MGYNQSIDSSYMFMPNYSYGLYGLSNPAAYNYCANTNPSIYTGGFNPMFGYGNYMTPTMPFTFNGLSTTPTVPKTTLAGTDLTATPSRQTTLTDPSAQALDTPEEEPEKKEGRSVWGKIGIGLLITAAVVGIGLGVDYKWNGSKCRKAIGDWFKNLGKVKPEGEKPKGEGPKGEGNKPKTPTEVPDVPLDNPIPESRKFIELLNKNPEEAYKYLETIDKSTNPYYNILIDDLNNVLRQKYSKLSIEELSTYIEKGDKSRAEEYFYALQELFNKNKTKENAEKLIKFLEECENGMHNIRLISGDALNKSAIEWNKGKTYHQLAMMFKQEGKLDKEFELLNKINIKDKEMMLKVKADMAENCIQRGQNVEGLRHALEGYNNKLPDLTNILLPNKQTVLEAKPVMEEMANACEKAGNADLAKSIRLVMKGGLEGKDKLTNEEIEFLTKNNISFEFINNADGSFTFPHQPYQSIFIKVNEYLNGLSA